MQNVKIGGAVASIAMVLSVQPGWADDPPPWGLSVTQQATPTSQPWTDPAILSYTINNDGKDSYTAMLNGQLSYNFGPLFENKLKKRRTSYETDHLLADLARDLSPDLHEDAAKFGVKASLAKTNQTTKPQDDFQIGPVFEYDYGVIGSFAVNSTIEAAYARTATFSSNPLPAACAGATPPASCHTQYKKSLRLTLATVPFLDSWEGQNKNFAYSFNPLFSVFNDQLTANIADPKTGLVQTGGYFGGLAGVALTVSPSFLDDRWVFKAGGQFRQRFGISASRKSSVRATAKFGTVDLTFYFTKPQGTDVGPRAGVGITYTKGEDPLTGKAKQDTVVLAFKVGYF